MALQIDSRLTSLIPQPSAAPTPSATTGRILPTPTAQSADVKTADTVKLSLSGQIHQLKSQGQSAKQIASSLGVSADTVAGYFSAPVAKPVAATTPTPSADGDVSAQAKASALQAADVKAATPVPLPTK